MQIDLLFHIATRRLYNSETEKKAPTDKAEEVPVRKIRLATTSESDTPGTGTAEHQGVGEASGSEQKKRALIEESANKIANELVVHYLRSTVGSDARRSQRQAKRFLFGNFRRGECSAIPVPG